MRITKSIRVDWEALEESLRLQKNLENTQKVREPLLTRFINQIYWKSGKFSVSCIRENRRKNFPECAELSQKPAENWRFRGMEIAAKNRFRRLKTRFFGCFCKNSFWIESRKFFRLWKNTANLAENWIFLRKVSDTVACTHVHRLVRQIGNAFGGVQRNGSAVGFYEAHHHVERCSFACTTMSDNCDRFTVFYFKTDIFKRRIWSLIRKADMIKFNNTFLII